MHVRVRDIRPGVPIQWLVDVFCSGEPEMCFFSLIGIRKNVRVELLCRGSDLHVLEGKLAGGGAFVVRVGPGLTWDKLTLS